MPQNQDVRLALDTLIEMGVLDENGLEKLGQLFRGVRALGGSAAGTSTGSAAGGRRRGRPRGTPARAPRSGNGRRTRGKLSAISNAEFRSMYIGQGMTAKEIAKKVGVSQGAVAVRASKLGLKKTGRGGGTRRKKKAKKTSAGRRTGRKKTAKKKAKKTR